MSAAAPAPTGLSEPEYEAAYREHFAGTVRWLARRGAVDAEDVAQRTWLRAWRFRSQFSGLSSVWTWVTAIAINEMAQDYRGKVKNYRNRRQWLDIAFITDAGRCVRGLEDSLHVNQILSRISAKHAGVLWQRFGEGLGSKEIQGGGNRTTAWRRVDQALKAARE